MKVFTDVQIKACDQYTISEKQIQSIDLMESAAKACFDWLKENYSEEYTYCIFCGKGNNGGDGLALARLLLEANYEVQTYIVNTSSKFSSDTHENFERYPDSVNFIDSDNFQLPEGKLLIIDAMIGTGLKKSLDKVYEKIISRLNSLEFIRISIDIPSGLSTDSFPSSKKVVFRADQTLSLGFHKRTFLHPEGAQYIGRVHILDIGLSQEFIDNELTNNYIVCEKTLSKCLKVRYSYTHKGDYGKAVLIGGSYGKMGAVDLSILAALRVGTGLVYAVAPRCGYEILQTTAPEAMFISGGDNFITHIDLPTNDMTIGIGPGLGLEKETFKALEKLIKQANKPLVLDADALNLISENNKLLESLPKNSIITPHPKEFERLFGASSSSIEQCELAREKAVKYQIIIVLKGHNTAILTPSGNCYYNITGNAGMAKGGSGDVLTGIITGFLAQGYTSEEAATLGVFIHGKAGDFAAQLYSQEAMVAQDIIKNLSQVFINFNNM